MEICEIRVRRRRRSGHGSGVFVAVVGCMSLGGCETEIGPQRVGGPGASLSALVSSEEPEGSHEVGPAGATADEDKVQAALDRARRVGARNREALRNLRKDERWADPSQHQGLRSAMVDTMGTIELYDAEADRLEDALAASDR